MLLCTVFLTFVQIIFGWCGTSYPQAGRGSKNGGSDPKTPTGRG
jgi:hypothetical protein